MWHRQLLVAAEYRGSENISAYNKKQNMIYISGVQLKDKNVSESSPTRL